MADIGYRGSKARAKWAYYEARLRQRAEMAAALSRASLEPPAWTFSDSVCARCGARECACG